VPVSRSPSVSSAAPKLSGLRPNRWRALAGMFLQGLVIGFDGLLRAAPSRSPARRAL
jgi:hypothetical protein